MLESETQRNKETENQNRNKLRAAANKPANTRMWNGSRKTWWIKTETQPRWTHQKQSISLTSVFMCPHLSWKSGRKTGGWDRGRWKLCRTKTEQFMLFSFETNTLLFIDLMFYSFNEQQKYFSWIKKKINEHRYLLLHQISYLKKKQWRELETQVWPNDLRPGSKLVLLEP